MRALTAPFVKGVSIAPGAGFEPAMLLRDGGLTVRWEAVTQPGNEMLFSYQGTLTTVAPHQGYDPRTSGSEPDMLPITPAGNASPLPVSNRAPDAYKASALPY